MDQPPPPPPAPSGGYPPGGAGYGAVPRNEGLAVAAMVCGICAVVLWLCYAVPGLVLGPIAFFMGLSARRRIAASGGALTGSGFALTGIITGAIGFVLAIVYILFFVGFIALSASGLLPSPKPSP
jgi:Domain of unknown function (DUF4190)